MAAELLVPGPELRQVHRPGQPLADEVQRLARHFKVSGFVVLGRLHELGLLSRERFWAAVAAERARIEALPLREAGGGGSFYANLLVRVSKRFAAAVVSSTLGGSTRYSDAFYYLGQINSDMFNCIRGELSSRVQRGVTA